MRLEIREAMASSPEDVFAIRRLIGSLAALMQEKSPITEEYVRLYLATPGNFVLIARAVEGGTPLGMISYSIRPNLYHAGESAMIEEMVVAEEARGGGVGGALLRHLLACLEAGGCIEVSVTTMPDNEGAIRFYKTHGLTDEAVFLEKHFGIQPPTC